MPESPAMVGQFSFKYRTISCFAITAEFINGWDQVIRIIFIIIDLGGFKPYIIDADFLGQFFYCFNLVFIVLYDQKLENNKWCFTFQLLSPFYDIPGSFEYFFQPAAYSVLLVCFLCGAVNRNDQTIQSAFDCSLCIGIIEIMSIGGSSSIDFF